MRVVYGKYFLEEGLAKEEAFKVYLLSFTSGRVLRENLYLSPR